MKTEAAISAQLQRLAYTLQDEGLQLHLTRLEGTAKRDALAAALSAACGEGPLAYTELFEPSDLSIRLNSASANHQQQLLSLQIQLQMLRRPSVKSFDVAQEQAQRQEAARILSMRSSHRVYQDVEARKQEQTEGWGGISFPFIPNAL